MECPSCGVQNVDLRAEGFCPACGAEVPPDPLIGRLVGDRFLITSLLAEGGMGRVYLAEQRMGETIRKVAVKTLLSETSRTSEQVARFLQECSTVGELEHPNTIKFYDYGATPENDLWIAMEFADGKNLSAVMRDEGPLPPERVDRLMAQVCGSLQEAHDKGIIHRDLKPDNIVVTRPAGEEDFVKVLDFGIAKRVHHIGPKLTPLGLVLGSPPYMSPEQFTPEPIDIRSDIYSLAVVAYEALTGHLPFNATTLAEWPLLHLKEAPLPFEVTEAGAEVPYTMKRAVMRALSKRRDQRQQSMREFYGELTIGAVRRPSLLAPPMDPPEPPTQKRSEPPSNAAIPIPPPPALPAFEPHEGGTREIVPRTVREPVPRTVRDPKSSGRNWLAILGFAAALAVGGAIAAFTELGGEHHGSAKPSADATTTPPPISAAPLASSSPAPTPTASASASTSLPPASASAVPIPATASSTAGLEPVGSRSCRQAIDAAILGNCELADRAKRRCPEDDPDHAWVHRTFDQRCGNHAQGPVAP